jgi:hypothetical protein
MLGFVKLAAISAVLSYGVVNAFASAEVPAEPTTAKLFQDRIVPRDEAAAPRLIPAVQVVDETTGSIATRSDGQGNRKGDRLAERTSGTGCEAQAWPYVSPDCIRGQNASAPKRVRVITIESRPGPNVSVLSRTGETVTKR